jgi:hypothetical protein
MERIKQYATPNRSIGMRSEYSFGINKAAATISDYYVLEDGHVSSQLLFTMEIIVKYEEFQFGTNEEYKLLISATSIPSCKLYMLASASSTCTYTLQNRSMMQLLKYIQ